MTTIDMNTETSGAGRRGFAITPALAGAARVIAALGAAMAAAHRRRRDAAILEQMPEAMLKDIGISRSDIDYIVQNGRI